MKERVRVKAGVYIAMPSIFSSEPVDMAGVLNAEGGQHFSPLDRPTLTNREANTPVTNHHNGEAVAPGAAVGTPSPSAQPPRSQAWAGLLPGTNPDCLGISGASLTKSPHSWDCAKAVAEAFPGAAVLLPMEEQALPYAIGSLWPANKVPEVLRRLCLPQPRGTFNRLSTGRTETPASGAGYQREFYGASPGYALNIGARAGEEPGGLYLLRLPERAVTVNRQMQVMSSRLLHSFTEVGQSLGRLATGETAALVYGARHDRPITLLGRLSLNDPPQILDNPLTLPLARFGQKLHQLSHVYGDPAGRTLVSVFYGEHDGMRLWSQAPGAREIVLRRPKI